MKADQNPFCASEAKYTVLISSCWKKWERCSGKTWSQRWSEYSGAEEQFFRPIKRLPLQGDALHLRWDALLISLHRTADGKAFLMSVKLLPVLHPEKQTQRSPDAPFDAGTLPTLGHHECIIKTTSWSQHTHLLKHSSEVLLHSCFMVWQSTADLKSFNENRYAYCISLLYF